MLETVELPGSSRLTTRLGFGGSGLMGGLSERESLRLLETAYDAGIRHFDVAPSYGHGMAERCLGRFLRDKRDAFTVTTKYGILPPARAGLLDIARSVARPFAKRLPALRRKLAGAAAGMTASARFTAAEAERSLDRSLHELGLDRVDLFLLHEADADSLEHSDMLAFLQSVQRAGRIGAFGIGSERSRVQRLWQARPQYCSVLQFECSLLASSPDFPGAFCIQHRTVSGALAAIREKFDGDPSLLRKWSEIVDANLQDSSTLAGLLLAGALDSRRGAMVLFSSRSTTHIRQNVQMCSDAEWRRRAERLRVLLAGKSDLSR